MIKITRENVDQLLDKGQIEVSMQSGRWWRIRRNGATRKWKRDTFRIYIPVKMGLSVYGTITEIDFANGGGALHPDHFRVKEEEKANV